MQKSSAENKHCTYDISITWTTLKSKTKMVRSSFPTTWKVAIEIKREGNQ